MLWSCHALNILWVSEIAQVLIGLTDAVVLGIVAVLYIGHTPGLIAYKLKGT